MQKDHFRIFVVEDNEWYNRLLVHYLTLDPEFEVSSFYNGGDLLKNLHDSPDVITIDYRLPDMNGRDLLRKIREKDDPAEVIVISEQEDIQTALDLMKEGAFEYLVKNDEIQARLNHAIGKIRQNAGLKTRIRALEKEVGARYGFEQVVTGKSPAMARVLELMKKAADNNITVTITGDTGTGKEMVAKAIHYNSRRRDKPFVAVNMSAIPPELFESEFFGHEKGAYTGAIARRKGKFEEAGDGTLFLDEILDTDINFQPKLLRALQEHEITRVGSNEVVKINCRLIVASNRNLQKEVDKGNFREDLYYRLFGLPIDLPPLRERGGDIPLLANHFIDGYCHENKVTLKMLSPEALNRLLSYSWPGNVRELKSVIELALILGTGPAIEAGDILFSRSDILNDMVSEEMTLRNYNKKILDIYLNKYQHNIPFVARKLGISQATVYRMMKG